MHDLPDAPWIRDAETNGIPFVPQPGCPVCGCEHPETYYLSGYHEIIGCDRCIKAVEACDYTDQEEEDL